MTRPMKHLKPLPPAVLFAHKLRDQARAMLRMADELEASAGPVDVRGEGVFLFGKPAANPKTKKVKP